MSADNRTVTTDALETLGMILDGTQGRDAIHLAVEPVIAVGTLHPGQHVGFVTNGVGVGDKPVGIVDPFLTDVVLPGQNFWLVVYPRQITSLRHVWTHPAFADVADVKDPKSAMHPSELWIRHFADSVCLHYNVLMEGAAKWVATHDGKWGGNFLCLGGLLEGESVPDEFWSHYDAVTGGVTPEDKRRSFFTCSC